MSLESFQKNTEEKTLFIFSLNKRGFCLTSLLSPLFSLLLLSCHHEQSNTPSKTPKAEAKADPAKIGVCDMSSDEAVKKAYLKLMRKSLRPDDCIQRPSSFPGFARVGPYQAEMGCRYDTVIFQCELADADVAAKVMVAAGWASASQEQKQVLALAWLTQIEDIKPLTESSKLEADHFKSQGMRLPPPEFEATPDGGLKIRYWLRVTTAGTNPNKEILYKRHQITFGPDGVKTGGTILASFSYKPAP
jgi:hypothetical protein